MDRVFFVGTPPRLDGRTINYQNLVIQPGDHPAIPFSYMNKTIGLPDHQICCYQTKTNERTHRLILDHLHLTIHLKEEVKGPRYVYIHTHSLSL
jgi:tRNA uridine 5-carboxymethylaminomethyl modification enzyme